MLKPSLILTSSSSSASRRRFFVYPVPKGSEEPNQLAGELGEAKIKINPMYRYGRMKLADLRY